MLSHHPLPFNMLCTSMCGDESMHFYLLNERRLAPAACCQRCRRRQTCSASCSGFPYSSGMVLLVKGVPVAADELLSHPEVQVGVGRCSNRYVRLLQLRLKFYSPIRTPITKACLPVHLMPPGARLRLSKRFLSVPLFLLPPVPATSAGGCCSVSAATRRCAFRGQDHLCLPGRGGHLHSRRGSMAGQQRRHHLHYCHRSHGT